LRKAVVYQGAALFDIRFMLINLRDGLTFIRKRDYRDGNGTFHIVFLTCNRDKQEGGELIELDEACHMGLPPTCKGHEMCGIKDMQTGKQYAVHNRLMFQLNHVDFYWQ
jgi:hypothetical protein